MSAAERVSEASNTEQVNERVVRTNGRASSPVLQSVFLAVLAQSGLFDPACLSVTTEMHVKNNHEVMIAFKVIMIQTKA